MSRFCTILLAALCFLTLESCEETIEIEIPDAGDEVVVEGYIEPGIPPFVILTRSVPYFSPTDIEQIENSFEHDAIITVRSPGGEWDTLTEINSDSVIALINILEDTLGVDVELEALNELLAITEDITLFAYTTPNTIGTIGGVYDLRVETTQGEVLTAQTEIPGLLPLDSIWVTDHPNPDVDSLVILNGRYTDVPDQENYVRYFTQRNREPFYPAYFNSVFDDKSIVNLNGESFAFTLERGYNRNLPPDDLENFGYFGREDTIIVRWCAIPESHYDFWSTLEFDRSQTGNPFGRPTEIKSNINGGLGVWGGYGCSYHTIIPQ